MEASELRQKSIKELEKMVSEHREKLRQLRFDLASGKIRNVREIRKTKKEIARMLTVLNLKLKKGS